MAEAIRKGCCITAAYSLRYSVVHTEEESSSSLSALPAALPWHSVAFLENLFRKLDNPKSNKVARKFKFTENWTGI